MNDLYLKESSNNEPLRVALTAPEAAKALGIGERLLWSETKSGHIPHVRIGTRVLYPVETLKDWLADQAKRGVNSELFS